MLTYKTFWQRFLAGFVDSLILIAIGLIITLIKPSNGQIYSLYSTIADYSIWLIYSIYLHGRYGQTIGKMLLKIKVTGTNGEKISYWQAIKRDSIYIILAIITVITFFTHKEDYAQYNESLSFISSVDFESIDFEDPEFNEHMEIASNFSSAPVSWLGNISLIYFILELVTMLTNKKRRALHDYIAKTEVRRIKM